MDLTLLIPFFADSPVSDDFDDVMLQLGIRDRPKGSDSTVFIRTPDEKVALEFAAVASFQEDRTMVPKSDGDYLLSGFDVYPGASHDLPFDLSWDMDIQAVQTVLGVPRKVKSRGATFFCGDLRITCRFKQETMSQLISIGISVIDVHAKGLYGL